MMEKFSELTGVAAFLPKANINTDILIRIERLIAVPKGQLARYCFEAWRYRPDGSDDPDFVLNAPAMHGARILLAGPNFGCGSSREAAVWALWDMGFRCVIAPSFGDIFFNNCFQNGMLPIVLSADTIASIVPHATDQQAQGRPLVLGVNLIKQVIVAPQGREIPFKIDGAKRRALLEGLDEIEMTLERDSEITQFQQADRSRRPWIYPA
jgi:3-isopropylmalate/(R)-2-methylmalate dehydratase small subunit